jgi:hypothetical protein
MKAIAAVLSVLTLPALPAQGVFSPAHFAAAEAQGYSFAGLGDVRVPARYLQVHDDLPGPMLIRRLALRRDASAILWPVPTPAYTLHCDAWMSNATTDGGTVVPTFDLNHGTNRVQVWFQTMPVSMPASSWVPFPMPAIFALPLSAPFSWNGTGSLAWEIILRRTTLAANVPFDYAIASGANPSPQVEPFGTGCRATSASRPMLLGAAGTASWQTPVKSVTLSFTGTAMPPSAPAWLAFGTSATSWAGLTLPFLLPGTDTAPSGSCVLYSSQDLLLPKPTSAVGVISANVVLAGIDASYHALSIFTQAIAIDPAANAFGVVLSNSTQHQILAPWTVTPTGGVYLPLSDGPVGRPLPRSGYVVKFE